MPQNKVVLAFESLGEILKCELSNKICFTALPVVLFILTLKTVRKSLRVFFSLFPLDYLFFL